MNNHLTRARLLMQQHRFSLAEEQLRLALMEGSESSTAHALLSLCLLERDQFDEATREAAQAIHDAPDEALGFYAMAVVLKKRNRLPDALTAIGDAIRLEPWNSSHFHVLAAIEAQRYRWKETLAATEQGLACDPEDIGCNNLRAIALVNLGRKAEAGQSIDATLSKNPEDAVTHANQGWTLLHQQQPRQAMAHFREALRLEPNLEWARQGVIEAMKARFFLYRWLLTWFLWLGRFPPGVQIGLMLGLVFGQTVLSNLVQMVPALAPLAGPLAFLYAIFVWMNWTASALFNLVLRIDPFGRLVLNASERRESTLAGVCLLLFIAVGLTSLFVKREVSGIPWLTALLYLGLMIPLVATFRQRTENRKWFGAYSLGVTVCVLMATYYSLSFCYQISSLPDDETKLTEAQVAEVMACAHSTVQWRDYSMWGIAISTWLGAGSSLIPNRR